MLVRLVVGLLVKDMVCDVVRVVVGVDDVVAVVVRLVVGDVVAVVLWQVLNVPARNSSNMSLRRLAIVLHCFSVSR